jgi:hypothetical protein
LKTTKWIYLLTGLQCLTGHYREEIDLAAIKIKLKKVFVTERNRITKSHTHLNYDYENSFIFYVRDGEKDDNFAQRFAEGIMLSLSLAYDLGMDKAPLAIRIPESLLIDGRILRVKDLMGGKVDIASDVYRNIVTGTGVPGEILDYIFSIVPALVNSQSYMDAAAFYSESISQVWVADDDVLDIVANNSNIPASQVDRARVETAYQNAYKAIEAIIGEPPKDIKKLRLNLINIGLNPDELVGYNLYGMVPAKEVLLKKIIDMQKNRDKKVAHGKTIIPRNIGLCELKDKQALTQYVILCAIKSRI